MTVTKQHPGNTIVARPHILFIMNILMSILNLLLILRISQSEHFEGKRR